MEHTIPFTSTNLMEVVSAMKLDQAFRFSFFRLSLFALLASPAAAQLSPGFYSFSCPNAELLVRGAVRSASAMDSTVPAKLLRLLFHDCLVEGCDGSVLVQGNGAESSDPANKSLDGFYVVESAKRLLEIWCPGTVSCADILVLAARDAVGLSGGPSVEVPLGRRDGIVSSASDVRPNMVDTVFSLDQMMQHFAAKGLSIDDLVALSGAHTIGSSHCRTFGDRFQQTSNGSLVPADNSLDSNYAMELANKCFAGASDSTSVANDPVTPSTFDNQYYANLLANKGLLHSDSILVTDLRTKSRVQAFAQSQEKFFESWADSFVKLSTVGVKTGDQGLIKVSCTSM
ncbi:peroxidase 18-like [Zingiber officinale]|uniref:peroxidase n=1 Tax=Zingiber officinale TaxID=94328 RepID=A0A8J5H8V8_ZINOF|nr:peroxidase 18-like [Zingiber officinale]KAG6518460.1 hypothetical protein ZIOFF_021935 [Zingiber officinale]